MSQIKTLAEVNVRTLPNAGSPTVTTPLKAGTIVTFLNSKNGWSNVQLSNNVTGWISSQYLTAPLEASNSLTLVNIILSIARSQIGLTEIPKGSNWGPHVKKFLASVGINFPAAWCMSFVYWVVNESCKELGIANPLVRTGHVLTGWNSIEKRFKIIRSGNTWQRWDDINTKYLTTTIQPGDIGILDLGGGEGHTFFVETASTDHVNTIEGNSNENGSREGYEVCRKPNGRNTASIKGFIRLS